MSFQNIIKNKKHWLTAALALSFLVLTFKIAGRPLVNDESLQVYVALNESHLHYQLLPLMYFFIKLGSVVMSLWNVRFLFLVISLFNIYILYKLLHLLFPDRKTDRSLSLWLYILSPYYLVGSLLFDENIPLSVLILLFIYTFFLFTHKKVSIWWPTCAFGLSLLFKPTTQLVFFVILPLYVLFMRKYAQDKETVPKLSHVLLILLGGTLLFGVGYALLSKFYLSYDFWKPFQYLFGSRGVNAVLEKSDGLMKWVKFLPQVYLYVFWASPFVVFLMGGFTWQWIQQFRQKKHATETTFFMIFFWAVMGGYLLVRNYCGGGFPEYIFPAYTIFPVLLLSFGSLQPIFDYRKTGLLLGGFALLFFIFGDPLLFRLPLKGFFLQNPDVLKQTVIHAIKYTMIYGTIAGITFWFLRKEHPRDWFYRVNIVLLVAFILAFNARILLHDHSWAYSYGEKGMKGYLTYMQTHSKSDDAVFGTRELPLYLGRPDMYKNLALGLSYEDIIQNDTGKPVFTYIPYAYGYDLFKKELNRKPYDFVAFRKYVLYQMVPRQEVETFLADKGLMIGYDSEHFVVYKRSR